MSTPQPATTLDSSRSILIWPAVVLILLASILGVLSAGDNVHELDVRISTNAQTWHGSLPEHLQNLGATIGGTIAAILLFTTCLIVTLVLKWREESKLVVLVAVSRLAAFFLKGIFESPRPTEDLVSILGHYENTGYPSGHSMTMAMVTTTVAMIVWRRCTSPIWRGAAITIGTLFTVMVGWSRIWAGAHWPTDVLGGWMYGVGFVLLASWIVYRPRPEVPDS
ncbi:MAG: phosphatase PAP2 family protein [Thermomicrobiales bacterium]|nr:phosphatase PAP2 family protein [Thermomicrobiales bacterium]